MGRAWLCMGGACASHVPRMGLAWAVHGRAWAVHVPRMGRAWLCMGGACASHGPCMAVHGRCMCLAWAVHRPCMAVHRPCMAVHGMHPDANHPPLQYAAAAAASGVGQLRQQLTPACLPAAPTHAVAWAPCAAATATATPATAAAVAAAAAAATPVATTTTAAHPCRPRRVRAPLLSPPFPRPRLSWTRPHCNTALQPQALRQEVCRLCV
eukprot:354359-Chlamydomonas_euryale.AAC.1